LYTGDISDKAVAYKRKQSENTSDAVDADEIILIDDDDDDGDDDAGGDNARLAAAAAVGDSDDIDDDDYVVVESCAADKCIKFVGAFTTTVACAVWC